MGTDRAVTLVAFDVETTGLSPDRAGITEVAAVKFRPDGSVVDTFQRFANPGHRIPREIVQLTGITDEMVKDAPRDFEVVAEWLDWLGPFPLGIAHNAPFDTRFVHGVVAKAGGTLKSFPVVDTLRWARKLSLPVVEYKLGTLLNHIGHRAERLHRALYDAHGVAALTVFLLNREGVTCDEPNCHAHLRKLARSSRTMCGRKFWQSFDAVSAVRAPR